MPHIGAARYGEKEKGKQLAPTTLQTSGLPTRSLVNVPNKLFHLPSVVGTRTEHRTCPFLNKVSAGKQPGQMNYKIHDSETNSLSIINVNSNVSARIVSRLYIHASAWLIVGGEPMGFSGRSLKITVPSLSISAKGL